jgi:3-polyprenyl-4-hydroxybenzoate decarboxylase
MLVDDAKGERLHSEHCNTICISGSSQVQQSVRIVAELSQLSADWHVCLSLLTVRSCCAVVAHCAALSGIVHSVVQL